MEGDAEFHDVDEQEEADTEQATGTECRAALNMQATLLGVDQSTALGLSTTPTVGIFLEEVGYFLEDMKKDLWWLLYAAHQPSGEVFFRGDEELAEVAPDKDEIIKALITRFRLHAESHENQVRAKITIIPAVTTQEMEILVALRRLRFHCRGKIEVFSCMKEANNAAIWGAYHNYVSGVEPRWNVNSDGAGQKSTFAQCVAVVPFFLDKAKQELKLLHVFCPDRKKRHWAFPGGDIIRGVDRNIYDAARREFSDEIGVFFGRKWEECFEAELPDDGSIEVTDERTLQFVSLEKDGVRYPCRPYFFVQVSEEFYDSTRAYEDAQGVIKMPTPSGQFVRWDDAEGSASRAHVDGVTYAEHDEARWLNLDFETGRLWSEDNRAVRRENVDFFKAQPEKIWGFFANLLGCAVPERTRIMLPSDFPTDGVLAVRMSGIDKTATNEDIVEFFEAGEIIKTSLVKQFDIPKHTARIEFPDIKMLEEALGLNGRMLLRRKVKVELWADVGGGGGGGADDVPGQRALKEYTGPLPEEAPFKIYIRGLDRSVTRDCLGYFFWDRNTKVHDVDFPLKNERHSGIVEFQDQDSLKTALGLNNCMFRGRELEIVLFNGQGQGPAPPGGGGGRDRGDRDRGERRDKGDRKGGGKGGGKRDGDRGGFDRRDDRGPPSREEFGSERPRLQLKPRSVPGASGGEPGQGDRPQQGYANQGQGDRPQQGQGDRPQQGYGDRASRPDPGDRASKPDPFGGARPRDDRFAHTRCDDDNNWRR